MNYTSTFWSMHHIRNIGTRCHKLEANRSQRPIYAPLPMFTMTPDLRVHDGPQCVVLCGLSYTCTQCPHTWDKFCTYKSVVRNTLKDNWSNALVSELWYQNVWYFQLLTHIENTAYMYYSDFRYFRSNKRSCLQTRLWCDWKNYFAIHQNDSVCCSSFDFEQ